MIEWKHREIVIEIAKYLNDKNIDFELLMLGSGNKKLNGKAYQTNMS